MGAENRENARCSSLVHRKVIGKSGRCRIMGHFSLACGAITGTATRSPAFQGQHVTNSEAIRVSTLHFSRKHSLLFILPAPFPILYQPLKGGVATTSQITLEMDVGARTRRDFFSPSGAAHG